MKRFDSFFALNLLVVSFLTYVYFYTSMKLDYFENNPVLKANYERKKELIKLKNELKELNVKNKQYSREVASINGNNSEAKILSRSVLEPGELAKNYFSEVKKTCGDPGLEMQCLDNIDVLVSQFPETIWAGESLIMLTEIYQKNNKAKEARDVLQILRIEFKAYSGIQAKIDFLEKQNL